MRWDCVYWIEKEREKERKKERKRERERERAIIRGDIIAKLNFVQLRRRRRRRSSWKKYFSGEAKKYRSVSSPKDSFILLTKKLSDAVLNDSYCFSKNK